MSTIQDEARIEAMGSAGLGGGVEGRRAIGRFLAANRAALAGALKEGLDVWREAAGLAEGGDSGPDLMLCEPAADYLIFSFERGESIYRQLLIGELLKSTHSPRLDREAQRRLREGSLAAYRAKIEGLAGRALAPPASEALFAELDAVIRTVTMPAGKSLDVLWIGDCLTLDLATFLAGPCREDGIEINPIFLTSYNPLQNREAILAQPRDGFALVFYSPFSYTFSADYSRTLKSVNPFATAGSVRRMIEPGLDEVRENLRLIADHFGCPIVVHNSSNVRRHDSTLADRVKVGLSWPARRLARREANRALERAVADLGGPARVTILDEHALLGEHSEWELGRRFYNSIPTHPTVLSRHLAATYRDYATVAATLMTRKLVVCDLDNTLWAGEIGEGAVAHFADRQAILKRLRHKGVLLAINSKNDPKNVHWAGSSLEEGDFVASRINWNPKVENMREIRDALNLKTKDFLFVDDRADQLEMVSAVFPEILGLDATDGRSWRLLDLWSRLLPDQDDLDRTQLYHERSKRESFIAVEAEAAEPDALLKRLGLKATLRTARAADLARAAELINRTNQFNLGGDRTSLAELKQWVASPDRRIFLADGADKFGQMGVVCVALVGREGRDLTISKFVLSCRVFGYGFEVAVLNAVARMALGEGPGGQGGAGRLIGLYKETPLNEPCRAMYPSQGYAWEDGRWVLDPIAAGADPSWLTIVDQTAR